MEWKNQLSVVTSSPTMPRVWRQSLKNSTTIALEKESDQFHKLVLEMLKVKRTILMEEVLPLMQPCPLLAILSGKRVLAGCGFWEGL